MLFDESVLNHPWVERELNTRETKDKSIAMSHAKTNELKVAFYYVAVNLQQCRPELLLQLEELHVGGQKAGNLAIWCAMSPSDLEDLIEKLEPAGGDELYFLGLWDGLERIDEESEEETRLYSSWLRGVCRADGLWLSHRDEVET